MIDAGEIIQSVGCDVFGCGFKNSEDEYCDAINLSYGNDLSRYSERQQHIIMSNMETTMSVDPASDSASSNSIYRGIKSDLSKSERIFWNRFPSLLFDDPEDEHNKIINNMRVVAEKHFRSN